MARNTGPERPEGEDSRQPREEERESIWTIPAKYKGWYFALFSLQIVIAAIWLIRAAILDDSLNSVPGVLLFIWQGMAPIAITSATFTLVIIDTWKTTMVFGTWLEETLEKRRQRQIKAAEERGEERGLEIGMERGLERGRTELQREWEDWNRRREAAAAAGEEFNEPPPGETPNSEEPQQ